MEYEYELKSEEKPRSDGRYCCVIGCSNSGYGLIHRWGKSFCQLHRCSYKDDACDCPPYELHCFPTRKKKPLEREKWLFLINRAKDPSTKELWTPGKSARVCSSHFIDGMPTPDHPYPTENLGYDSKRKVDNIVNRTAKPRRKKFKLSHSIAPSPSVIDHDHSYFPSSNTTSAATTANDEVDPQPYMDHDHSYFSSSNTTSAATTANDEEDPRPYMEIEEPPVSSSNTTSVATTANDEEDPQPNTTSAATTANDEEDPQPYMEIEEPPVSTSSSSATAIAVTVAELFTFVMFLWSLVLMSCQIINFTYIFIVSYRRKLHTIQILSTQVVSLFEENDRLRRRIGRHEKREKKCRCKLSLFDQLIKNDKDILFYTGIPDMSTFKKLHKFISPSVRRLWRGAKETSTKMKRNFKCVPGRFGPERKISGLDQFLLMWMKLKLNAPLRDLADRFNISKATCSRIISSWTKASADILKSPTPIPGKDLDRLWTMDILNGTSLKH